jgi:predicted esterase
MQGGSGAPPIRVTDRTGEVMLGLLGQIRAFLKEETSGKDPFALRTGYLERAYVSSIDDSAQPYFVMVPESARPALGAPNGEKKFPLVIFLHGYVEEYHKHRWWTADPIFNGICSRLGAFLAIPFGRSNTDFLGPGEVDVLDVLKEMKRLYPIDPDRVYLYGYSMGGMGVYSLGGHYPDLWAAGIVIAGRADSPLLMGTLGLDTLHPFKQFLIRTDQPIDLCENFVNIPLRVFHGRDDAIIPGAEARRMVTRLKRFGCEATLRLYPGDHWFGFDLMADEAQVKWLLTKRRPSRPGNKRLKNYSVRFGGHRGIQVNHLTGKLEPFHVNWTTAGNGGPLIHLDGPVTQVVLGVGKAAGVQGPEGFERLTPARPGDAAESTVFSAPGWGDGRKDRPWNPSWKSPVRCGPVKEATYGPFLVVYGTTGGAGTTALLKDRARAFADEWYLFAKGVAAVKADRDVTDEDKRTKNLILFGQEHENALHALAAKTGDLPLSIRDDKVSLGGRTVSLAGRGVLWIYPSPFEGAGPERSIVITAGVRYGAHLPVNHKLDLVPDFLIYTGEMDVDGTRTNRPVAAGFFDGRWKLNGKTTWWFND